MKIHPAPQGSIDWMIARSSIPTASEFGNLLTPDFKVREGEMPKTYINEKLAEAWLGGPLMGANVFDMDQGKILEEEARPWLALELNTDIQQVGLITTDDGKVGCSPDGLMEGGGVEIKCPAPQTHVGYLINGGLPKQYAAQVHGSMFVTGFHSWKFLSYRRGFPKLVLTIERDEEIQEKIAEAIDGFRKSFDAAWEKLINLNGGPPARIGRHQSEPPVEVNQDGITP